MREICTSGTVRGGDGNILTYSERAFTQQGLAATCKDLSYKGETRNRKEGKGLAHESV
jgi:hypothetical protein